MPSFLKMIYVSRKTMSANAGEKCHFLLFFSFSQSVTLNVFRRLILRVLIRNIMILCLATIFHVTSRDGTTARANKMREIGEE